MKIIIPENKRNRTIIKWLDNNYGKLKRSFGYNSPEHLFYEDADENDILYYDKKRDLLQIWDKSLQQDLIHMFGVEENELNDIEVSYPGMEKIEKSSEFFS